MPLARRQGFAGSRVRRRVSCAIVATLLLGVRVTSAQTPVTGALTPPLSPRNASYTIQARLDPSAHTITGTETVTWRNITHATATELPFHLYWNAWRDARSTWMRESALAYGSDREHPASDWSRIDVTSIHITQPSAVDLTAAQHFITPDDNNTDDRTVMAVSLPEPIGPGGAVVLEISWTAHVPRTFARTGVIGNFFFIAQWFPKVGVLQDDGWNCHQFHAGTEFFSDYGTYNVSLTVPQRWTVGATGVQQSIADNADGTATHRYRQDDVHDFAWTTSPDLLVRTARFEHPSLPPVEMRLLLQPEHADQADRHFDATRRTLRYYSEWFGAYPYGHITIVDPAFHSGAGGMEYPTLFTAGTRWLAPSRVQTPEEVTVHEAGHQFWYGIVGNNEFEDAWMDEGLNTFSTARALDQGSPPNAFSIRYFGGFVPWVFPEITLSREIDGNRLAGYRRDAKSDVPSTPSFRYFPSTGGSITYNKTALWLNTLERSLGWPVLQRAMAAYFERWRFQRPRPDDFFHVISETSGRNLDGFFDQVYRSSNIFDYGVQDLSTEKENGQFRSTVVVRRFGEAIFPVDVLMTFDDGSHVTERWDGVDRWKAYTYVRPSAILSAQVDPNRVLLLDVNYTNNSKTLHPEGTRAATKWSLTWMTWLQDCLLSWAALV